MRPEPAPDVSARAASLKRLSPRPALAESLLREHRRLAAPQASIENCARIGAAVVAGQQPAPGLGPLYALHKAAAAVALARRLDAVPVYWIAGDDHDLDEAARVHFQAAGRWETSRAPVSAPRGTPLNRIPCDAALRTWLEAWRQALPPTLHRDPLFERLVRHAQGSWADWVARTLLDLFGGMGLVVVEPSWLRREAAWLMARYAEGCAEDAECRLFESRDGLRRRSTGPDPKQVLAEPERFSPDVLLRPVMQDALLPTLIQVCGPGEMEYLPRASELYARLGVEEPVRLRRPTATLLAREEADLLHRLGGVLGSEEALLAAARERAGCRPDLPSRVTALGRRWEEEFQSLAAEAKGLEGLEKPAGRTRASVRQALEAFARKAGAAEERKAGIDHARIAALASRARPGGKPQEKVWNAWAALCRFGPGIVERLVNEVDWGSEEERILVG